MINVGICFGGKSVEHDISIITYIQVLNGIDTKKYEVVPLYLGRDGVFYTSNKMKNINSFKDNKKFKIVNFKRKNNNIYANNKKLDCVIICVHGKDLEDGTISSFFNTLSVCNTAPDIYTSTCFHNKYLTKLVLRDNNIPVLKFVKVSKESYIKSKEKVIESINNELGSSVKIIKPVTLGSSIGINICKNDNELLNYLDNSFKYDDYLIVEKCISSFKEYNQAVYKNKDEVVLSRIEEVENDSNFYSFTNKYEKNDSKRILPAKISNNLKLRIYKTTKKIQKIFNNQGVIRVDYLYREKDKKLFVNEINVIPGALAYYLFEDKGIYFNDLLDDLIMEAIRDKNKKDDLILSFKSNVLYSKKISKK